MIALAGGIWLDLCLGDPHTIPHPVRAMGMLISALDERLFPQKYGHSENLSGRSTGKSTKKGLLLRGFILWMTVMVTTVLITLGIVLVAAFTGKVMFVAVDTVLTYYCLAARSLYDESMKVYECLQDVSEGEKSDTGHLEKAREALSMIVGRDTERLDENGIVRAAVETVAENTSDGVIAPLLCTAVGGPILGMCYKAINTMDSMIGYKNERYEYFGRFAARADDVANYIPSRISAYLMIGACGLMGLYMRIIRGDREILGPDGTLYSVKRALSVYIRDRRKHKSPNSAQTESVCAGALGIVLGGRSYYGGIAFDKPAIGDDTRRTEAEDIRRANKLMFVTEGLCTVAMFITIGLILIFL